MSVEILNFTGIYEREYFYRERIKVKADNLRELKDADEHCLSGIKDVKVQDFRDLPGTSCMCDDAAKVILLGKIKPYGLHFIDNGNYHYMSALYTSKINEPFDLVVLDHHPDMQRPMFDILSCGGWVLDALESNKNIRSVHVIGADNKLIEELSEDDRKRAAFHKIMGRTAAEVVDEVLCANDEIPVYLSIDKDVISRDEIVTNWDQGDAAQSWVLEFTKALLHKRRVLGIDICGECAPDQIDVDLEAAIRGNDEFNAQIIDIWYNESGYN